MTAFDEPIDTIPTSEAIEELRAALDVANGTPLVWIAAEGDVAPRAAIVELRDAVDAVAGSPQVWAARVNVPPTSAIVELRTAVAALTGDWPVEPYVYYDWSDEPTVENDNPRRPKLNQSGGTVEWGIFTEHGSHRMGGWNYSVNGIRVLHEIPQFDGNQYLPGDVDHADISPCDVLIAVKLDVLPTVELGSTAVLCLNPAQAEAFHYITPQVWFDADDDDKAKWAVTYYTTDELSFLLRSDVLVDTDAHVFGIRVASPAAWGFRIDLDVVEFRDAHAYDTDTIITVAEAVAQFSDPIENVGSLTLGANGGGWYNYWPEVPGSPPDGTGGFGFDGWTRGAGVFPILSPSDYATTVDVMLAGVWPEVTVIDGIVPFVDPAGSLTEPFTLADLGWTELFVTEAGITEVAGDVSAWVGAEGTALGFIVDGGTILPRIGDVSTPGGRDAITFDGTGSGKRLRADVTWGVDGFTFVVVCRMTEWDTEPSWKIVTDPNDAARPNVSGFDAALYGGVRVSTNLNGLDVAAPADGWVAVVYSCTNDADDKRAVLATDDATVSASFIAPAASVAIAQLELGRGADDIAFFGYLDHYTVEEDAIAIAAQAAAEYLTP